MPFPVSPAVGTLHTIPTGSVYRFNSKGAWQLSKIGRGYLPETGRLSLAPDVMPAMIVGSAFSQAVTASGGTGPYTYALAGGAFPAGLSMTTGTISGTPTTAGPYAFTIRATDSTGGTPLTVERDYSGQVLTSAITILPDSISGLLVGKPYNQTFTASGGTAPYTWAVSTGTLPAGLSLAPSTGIVSGTPTTPGAFAFTLRATDSASKIGTKAYGGVVGGNVLTITPTKMPLLNVASAVAVQFTAAGGTAPYTWDVQTGALPAGLNLNAGTGLISGTPTTAGAYSFTLRATDAIGQTGAVVLSGTVTDAIGKIWNPHTFPYAPRRLVYRASDSKFQMLSAAEMQFQGFGPSFVHSSADGITWSLENQLSFNAAFIGTLNGKAVVAGVNNILIDGVASTLPTKAQIYAAAGVDSSQLLINVPTQIHVFSVAYGGGFYVATGIISNADPNALPSSTAMPGQYQYNVPFILRSTNSTGAVFQAQTPPAALIYEGETPTSSFYNAGQPIDVVYAFGKFVLMTGYGFMYSTSGASGTWVWPGPVFARWDNSYSPYELGYPIRQAGIYDYAHMRLVNNILFAFGGYEPNTDVFSTTPYYSQDGVTWSPLRIDFPWSDVSDIAHNGNFYVAVATQFIGTSTNLNTWTTYPLASMPELGVGGGGTTFKGEGYHHLVTAAPAGGKFVSAYTTSTYSSGQVGSGIVLTSYP